MSEKIQLSIIVPLVSRVEDSIPQLEALESQTLPPSSYEVVLVDSRGQDGPAIPESRCSTGSPDRSRIQYFRIGVPGRSSAVNFGLQHSTGEIVLLLADDFIPEPDLAQAHLDFHRRHPAESRVGIGSGRFSPALREDDFRRWLEDSGKLFGVPVHGETTSIPSTYFYGANASAKRSFLEKVGGFDEDFPYAAWDDYEVGQRMLRHGMESTFLPGATAWHEHPVTLGEYAKSTRKAGESAVLIERKTGEAGPWKRRANAPPWFYSFSARFADFQLLLTGDPVYRFVYFERTLDAAFSEGYLSRSSSR